MRPAPILFAATLLPLPTAALAQAPPVIPYDANDLRKFLREGDSRCPQCGVVMDVRMAGTVGGAARDARDDMDVAVAWDSGPGNEVHMAPLLVISDGGIKRPAEPKPAEKLWRVTVRYDNGSYATFDQAGMPTVSKGDRIQVVAGRVERR